MSRKFFVLLSTMLVSALILGACSTAAEAAPTAEEVTAPAEETAPTAEPLSGTLQIAGSTTVQPLAEVLAETFMEANPDVVIEIQGGGSSVGVTSAGDGTVAIGSVSREIKSSELETYPDLAIYTIAYDGIAVIVNPELDIPSLSVEQVRGIFSGEITNFSEVGGPDAEIVVVSREEGSGTRAAFEELVMVYKDENGETVETSIVENALLQQSNGQISTVVSTTPNTIGYLSFGYLSDAVKGIAIDNVDPTVENVKNGTYSIYRPLSLLTKGEAQGLAKAFIDFILSDAGQEIVAEDYITVQ
ncbi:MAG TPA: phosphate ABC transporter substrate-binding protein [Anaerolineaceae bacterium]|jgi:phosphate transport system substrate-binding protein|nr:phosphate ABC transporter substrate-binding protein [Anaerolineaceae bacterium]